LSGKAFKDFPDTDKTEGPRATMQSCLFTGWVRHRRFLPTPHAFAYSGFWLYLDLAELDEVFRGRWLWSTRRFAWARFRREDHLGDPKLPLDTAVRDLVETEPGRRPDGPIRLLTHPRYLGYVMNPVSFYYCFAADETRLTTIVAEVHNTPWNEEHCYILDESQNRGSGSIMRFEHPKDIHVSPFMEMDYTYRWRISEPANRLAVHIDNLREGVKWFDVTFLLKRRPITGFQRARVLIRHPWMTGKVTLAIYWQALRLWLKKIPFVPHPHRRETPQTRSS
jgi:DUF1365 family protein